MGIVPIDLRKHISRYLEDNAMLDDAVFKSVEVTDGSLGGLSVSMEIYPDGREWGGYYPDTPMAPSGTGFDAPTLVTICLTDPTSSLSIGLFKEDSVGPEVQFFDDVPDGGGYAQVSAIVPAGYAYQPQGPSDPIVQGWTEQTLG